VETTRSLHDKGKTGEMISTFSGGGQKKRPLFSPRGISPAPLSSPGEKKGGKMGICTVPSRSCEGRERRAGRKGD